MANSKARSNRRPASAQAARSAAGTASKSARTAAAASATPTSRAVIRQAPKAVDPAPAEDVHEAPERTRPVGQPLWLQLTSLVLAVLGLAISAYETYAHFNGNRLAGCPTGGNGTFNCSAVITSSQSMVFGIFPVAILGLLFYVAAVPLFSPWGWRVKQRAVHQLRLASMIVGMGFVMYLIYAELQIGSICEYCTGVHVVTFLLFCITVFSAAIWGLGDRREAPGRRA
ncbi:MAG TPA: vitamin K epoxide reductase family protein [Trebonia sp.]